VILFPIAAVWLAVMVIWAIRRGVFQPPEPEERVRERPRPPRGPRSRPHDGGPHDRLDRDGGARRGRRGSAAP
jgi:hypothetical protein